LWQNYFSFILHLLNIKCFVMETISVFNLFQSIVGGKYVPHKNDFDTLSSNHIPSFDMHIEPNGHIFIEALEGFLYDEDEACADLWSLPGGYALEQKVIELISQKSSGHLNNFFLPIANSPKGVFYYTLIKVAFCLSVSRILKQAADTNDSDYKIAFSDGLIVHLRAILKELDAYELNICYNNSHLYSDDNIYAINLTRRCTLQLLALIVNSFDGFCRFSLSTAEEWQASIYGKTPTSFMKYNKEWPFYMKAKAIIGNMSFVEPTNEEIIILYKNTGLIKFYSRDFFRDFLLSRIHGYAKLLPWLIFKDRDDWDSILSTPVLSEARLKTIAKNEHQMYNEFLDIVYSEVFLKVFEKVLPVNRIRIATDDLKYIDGIIDNTISNDEMRIFSQAYDVQRSRDLTESIQKVLRGTVYETKGYAILKHSEAHALIRYRNFLSDFLNKEKSGSTIQSNSKPDIISNGKIKLPLSYYYIGFNKNPGAIADLLDSLKKCGFVAPDTNVKDFKKIFRCEKPDTPIMWYTHVSDLAYFIKYIHREIKVIENMDKTIWTVSANLFVLCDGTHIDAEKLKGQKKPARAKELESAANHLK